MLLLTLIECYKDVIGKHPTKIQSFISSFNKIIMPLYYYDEQGYKVGPISKKELFALAASGKIAPETRLTDGKNESTAKFISGLKFIAPEYYQAEEIFDPKNYNLNEFANIHHSETAAKNRSNYTNNKPKTKKQPLHTNKLIEQVKQYIKQHENTNIEKKEKKYKFLRRSTTINYAIAAFIFYITIFLTIIGTGISIVNAPALSPIIGILGIIISFLLPSIFGVSADIFQWMIDIETHLEKKPSDSNTDSNG